MRSWYLVLAISVLVLVGCAPPEEVVTVTPRVLPTATPLPTGTALAFATPTSVGTTSPTVVMAETPALLPTNTATPLFTPTRYGPLPTRPPTVPTVPFQSETNYRLIRPSSDSLLEVMRRIAEYDDIHVDREQPGRSSPYWQANNMVKIDMDNFYPGPFPNAVGLLNDYSLTSYYFGGWNPSIAHLRLLEDGFIQYLNSNQIQLATGMEVETDAFVARSFPIDLENDSKSEWIIQIRARLFRVTKHLLLREDSPGHYGLLSNNLPGFIGRYHSDGFTYIYADDDLTGDGLNDIIVHNDTYLGGNSNDISLQVYSWSGNDLQQFPRIDLAYHSLSTSQPIYEIRDFNSDEIKDIQVTYDWVGNFDCDLQYITLHWWSQETMHTEQTLQTNVPACYIWKSIRFNDEPAEIVAYLQQALSTWVPVDAVTASEIALAGVHLAMAQMALGQTSEAQATLEALYQLPRDARFVQQVLQAYESAEKRPLQTCRNLMANSEALLETEIGYYLSWNAADPYMVTWGGKDGSLPHLPTICNYGKAVEYLVKNAVIPTDQSPVEVLAAQDIHYEFATQYNLDNDLELEWVGITKLQWPVLLIFDPVNGVWQPKIRWLYLDELTDFVISSTDVTGDGQEDVIGLVTGANYCYELEAQTNYQDIQMFYTEDSSARFVGHTLSCIQDELLKIDDVVDTHFDRNPIIAREWETLSGSSATPVSLYEHIQELQTAVLAQADPTIPTQITDLLDYLPTDDPEARPYREHLTYLLGYYYELSGDADTAVTTYLSLIQLAATSPWAWLAWARLEPVTSGDN